MTITTGPLLTDEAEKWFSAMSVPFADDVTPERLERSKRRHRLDRATAAKDGDEIVGTFGSFSFLTTVPGGELPTSGVTAVAVLPTHRRRGILTRLMTEHIEVCRDRNEPLASLWASEPAIYGRYGFGVTARHFDLKLTVQPAMFRDPRPSGFEFRLISSESALDLFPPMYERARLLRPGMFARTPDWWRILLEDPADRREGWSSHRRVVASVGGEAVGYAIFRARWNEQDRQTVRVSEVFGFDAAERELWRFLTEMDLVSEIINWNDPIDRSFDWWLSNPRLAVRKTGDALYLRLVDVETALGSRQYAAFGDVTVDVTDPICPWNERTFRLSVTADGPTCETVDADPDVRVDVAALGSAYLGDASFVSLATVGRATGDPEALSQLARMFAWDIAPYCQEMF
ncbi:MAG: GNAT family N-acetyltransferase [Acidimicrobiia bacterium]|nr:GNAT family N-acetyltransferase [Acidimicrobiia bacterium]